MDWQEAAVAVIVGTAVVSLYRHLRGLFAAPKPGAGASCRGCGDCADEEDGRTDAPAQDVSGTVH